MSTPARMNFGLIPVIDVSRELLGAENPAKSNAKEKHFPDHAGLFVNVEKNAWYSHGNGVGGDAVELVRFILKCNHSEAFRWLRENGYETERSQPQDRRLADTYDYADANGELLYQVVRYEPKEFRQRRPLGKAWAWGLKEGIYQRSNSGGDWYRVDVGTTKLGEETADLVAIKALPYRLPELLRRPEARILLAGGEKDVDNLRRLGFTATCNHGGEGKWWPELTAYFKNRRVVILCDNDRMGEKHQRVVGAALKGTASEVRVVRFPRLPDGGDVSDHIEQRLSLGVDKVTLQDELDERFRNAPAWEPQPEARPHHQEKSWPVLNEDAYYGFIGNVVRAVGPHSEADPVAILLQMLAAAGNAMGRCAHYRVESDWHHTNLFTVLVGQSGKARKGTSWGRVKAIAKVADQAWVVDRTKGGLSSGEGFIFEVRDPVTRWDAKDQVEELIDPGIKDKRLTIIEPEFAAALAVMDRPGNTLSPLIRKAWDGDKLSTLTKNSPLQATGAHISIIGHITEDELRARLTRTDTANGFANRFLFALVKRSKELPFGGDLDESEILALGRKLDKCVFQGNEDKEVSLTEEAREVWATIYSELSAGKPGLVGAVTARAEAQTIRLALIYALLDGSERIDVSHLKAALAVWKYCEASAAYIFGNMSGDPVEDTILRALKSAGDGGLTRTAIRDLFNRHQPSGSIDAALAKLLEKGLVRKTNVQTPGRPAEVWVAT